MLVANLQHTRIMVKKEALRQVKQRKVLIHVEK